ncbi:PSD1 and planctomycete cytochrome C domain-containing protein [Mucilaginibacter sabulilitoris]|uniref:PSD1 and planctomycete cytochrome C domain-containing protein n=1 Tax=Mucilaginibacter sabulilitoris TaxID=1173583 RepID=A0ABZ0TZW6_9SPHI|nr:PSD1 and planctomycete cytochrome C domain-containing protein [Mucilaginibacter sabulilitoris]WPU97085.1 PSD1 and planctomycete cytochrome C domain-containing protein [Mucilaginibacter sabulilitoris]
MSGKYYYLWLIVALFVLYSVNACRSGSDNAEQMPETVSYNFNIRPILSDKCFKCHGPDATHREAGLRLDLPDSAFKALKDNPSAHALVPGNPLQSEVFRRVSTKDTAEQMPPASSNLKKLNPYEVSLIEKWIKQGAKYEKHWAFVPPKSYSIPQVKNTAWPKNQIDNFVLQKLEQNDIEPNPEADKERLLKRVALDLTGLPPSLQMMDGFLADKSPNAYEKIVDQLMASPQYGEKMTLHWLDVARYADSHGYQDDNYRSQWPWRDWVIHAFNENLPYDKFITWQLAGDQIPNATKEQLLATGFNRNHKITEEGGVIDEEYRVSYVTDRTNTFGKAMLGVTLECAHCHDHKYDPFSQKEYYEVFAFFNSVKEVGIESVVGGPETYAKKPLMQISNDDVKKILTFINKQDTDKLIVSIMTDSTKMRPTYILKRGNYDAHGVEVQPGTPASILPFTSDYPKNRLGLAEWLFNKKNPLAARVFVNQVWQEFFGKGIVKSSGDFGMQGDLPSHPELLDWLSVDFRDHGWNIKRLVKRIVMSATYRQSAVATPEKLKNDPDNTLLARGPRGRLPAEFVRDLVLASSGLLNRNIGGPSVNPYQPPGLWENATSGRGQLASYKQVHGPNLYRRGMYTLIKRTVPPASLGIFDASNRDQCEVKRLRTNTPLQALVMLNDPTVLESARVLAAKLLQESSQPKDKIVKAFRLIMCRHPQEKELAILTAYYQDELKSMKKIDAAKLLTVGEYPVPANLDKVRLAAMMKVVDAMYNLEEAITKT